MARKSRAGQDAASTQGVPRARAGPRGAQCAQRDEARELVRRYVLAARCHPADWDAGRRAAFAAGIKAVARWDEEAKR